MNGVHDMGGMHGFGPVDPDDVGPFHAAWEARVSAIMRLTRDQDLYNIDAFRYGIEQMEPAAYLRSSYFERWLATVEYNLIENGAVTPDEIEARTNYFRDHPDEELPRRQEDEPAWQRPERKPEPEIPAIEPRFAVGDLVMTRNVHPAGHTRLPRYARGKRGVINRVHGAEIFPDTNAHGQGQHPLVVYSVRFDGRELWSESAEANESVYIDLWESYLEPREKANEP